MTKKDIGNLPFPEPGESICAEEDRRIAELEARLEASQEALAEILVLNKANQDRAETAEATLAKYQAVVDAAVEETEAETEAANENEDG